jgi:hypothetical protein
MNGPDDDFNEKITAFAFVCTSGKNQHETVTPGTPLDKEGI